MNAQQETKEQICEKVDICFIRETYDREIGKHTREKMKLAFPPRCLIRYRHLSTFYECIYEQRQC